MPCRADYMEPYANERESHKVAKFIIYVKKRLGIKPTDLEYNCSRDIYTTNRQVDVNLLTDTLCSLIKNLSASQLDCIVYNARNKESRELADWWEKHQEKDAKRLEQELKIKQKERLKRQGLAKLTKEEKEALGL